MALLESENSGCPLLPRFHKFPVHDSVDVRASEQLVVRPSMPQDKRHVRLEQDNDRIASLKLVWPQPDSRVSSNEKR